MSEPPARIGLRQRRREELVDEVLRVAQRHLVTEGAAGLSVRAIAREIGIAPSALYRYFPSRDDLLTALIARTYTEIDRVVGAAVDEALADHPGDLVAGWVDATVTYREWAHAHPAEFALVYGTPVPGYRAPEEPMRALGQQAGASLSRLLEHAVATGTVDLDRLAAVQRRMSPDMVARMSGLARERGLDVGPDTSAAALTMGLGAWSKLQGLVAMELFGHVPREFPDAAEHFRLETAALAERFVRPEAAGDS